MLESVALAADAGAIEVLLSRARGCEITSDCLSSAARRGDEVVINLLLVAGGFRNITSDVLEQAAYHGNEKTLQLLLDKAGEVKITEDVLFQAASCREDGKTVRMLLARGGKVTQNIVLEAASSSCWPALGALLESAGRITEQVLRHAARNVLDGRDILKTLLDQVDESTIMDCFTSMISEAAENTWQGPGVVAPLLGLEGCKSVPIVEDVLLALITISGNRILNTMLQDGRDMEIAEEVLKMILRKLDFDGTIQNILQRAHSIVISEEMLVAAARNRRFGDEMLKMLLEKGISCAAGEDTIKAVVANRVFGSEMISLLQKHCGEIKITEEVMKSAAAHGSPATMGILLCRD